jgi:hypothetical protein
MVESPAIPYEQQAELSSNRTCGAAALCMVYRSFGLASSQAEVWPRIARHNRAGVPAARTHLLAADALRRGLAALVVQAGNPAQILERAGAAGLRVILNHRLQEGSPAGHYTVLVGLDEEQIILHDPQHGPNRRLARSHLLELWRPHVTGSEIVGQVLVALSNTSNCLRQCSACGTSTPHAVTCPGCLQPFALQPAAILGCVKPGCSNRTWQRLYCPLCDASVSVVLDPEALALRPDQPRGRAMISPQLLKDYADELGKIRSEAIREQGATPVTDFGTLVKGMHEKQATAHAKFEAAHQKELQRLAGQAGAAAPKPEAPAATQGGVQERKTPGAVGGILAAPQPAPAQPLGDQILDLPLIQGVIQSLLRSIKDGDLPRGSGKRLDASGDGPPGTTTTKVKGQRVRSGGPGVSEKARFVEIAATVRSATRIGTNGAAARCLVWRSFALPMPGMRSGSEALQLPNWIRSCDRCDRLERV